MATSITIDEDAFQVAQSFASQHRTTLDEAVSTLVREGSKGGGAWETRNGIPQLPVNCDDRTVITPEFIRELQDELGI